MFRHIMENSDKFLKSKGTVDRISFKDGKIHTVKLMKDKIDKIKDANGVEKEGVKYMVIEGGEPKTFFTTSIGLIQKLAEHSEGTEVVIQMKSKKVGEEFKSYYEVSLVEKDLDIPIIEDESE